MQKILVTGASGFLGTNLVSKLSKNRKLLFMAWLTKRKNS